MLSNGGPQSGSRPIESCSNSYPCLGWHLSQFLTTSQTAALGTPGLTVLTKYSGRFTQGFPLNWCMFSIQGNSWLFEVTVHTSYLGSVFFWISSSYPQGTLVSWLARFSWDLTNISSIANSYYEANSLRRVCRSLISISNAALVRTIVFPDKVSEIHRRTLTKFVRRWITLNAPQNRIELSQIYVPVLVQRWQLAYVLSYRSAVLNYNVGCKRAYIHTYGNVFLINTLIIMGWVRLRCSCNDLRQHPM